MGGAALFAIRSRVKARAFFSLFFVSTIACGGASAPGAGGATASSATSKTYPIHLSHRSHVGDRRRIAIDELDDNTSIMRLVSNGRIVSRDRKTQSSHLEGVMTTVALDPHGDELKATLDVTTLRVDDAVVLRNRRIEITKAAKSEDAVLLVDGTPVTSDLRKVLKDLLSLRVGGVSDDDIFGTRQPQPVGGHWPIDGDRARADLLADADSKLGTEKISGETTFAGVEHVGDVEALRFEAEMKIEGITFPLPPGATSEPGRAKASMNKLVPVDESRGVIESHMTFELTARIHAATPDGDDIVGDLVMTSRHDDHSTPL